MSHSTRPGSLGLTQYQAVQPVRVLVLCTIAVSGNRCCHWQVQLHCKEEEAHGRCAKTTPTGHLASSLVCPCACSDKSVIATIFPCRAHWLVEPPRSAEVCNVPGPLRLRMDGRARSRNKCRCLWLPLQRSALCFAGRALAVLRKEHADWPNVIAYNWHALYIFRYSVSNSRHN
eukprot:scaffold278134_cov19-Tisochrysis_lutea.AAC.2